MGFLASLFGFNQYGVAPLADGYAGNRVQDAAITFELPIEAKKITIPDPNNPGQTMEIEPLGNRLGRYARMLLGWIGYINTSVGMGNDAIDPYAIADGRWNNGAQVLPALGYSGLKDTGKHPGVPAQPPTGPPAPPGGGFPGAQYVGRVERMSPLHAFAY